jgi:hypothetical protein
MDTPIIVRTFFPELDAVINLGLALQHSFNLPVVDALYNAIAVVSDNARDKGARDSDVYDAFHTGLTGTTTVPGNRDEVIVTAHLARALIYIDRLDSILAVAAAFPAAVAAIATTPDTAQPLDILRA